MLTFFALIWSIAIMDHRYVAPEMGRVWSASVGGDTIVAALWLLLRHKGK